MKPPETEAGPGAAPRSAEEAGDHSPTLREIQERFLAELRQGEDGLNGQAPTFLDPPHGSAAQRWQIYRSAYRVRLADAIRNDYEALARIVGDALFRDLAERYLEAHPPASHDIGRAGDRLAEFLVGDPLTEKLPFLPDLARFEAALAASLVAADSEPVTPERLAALDPEALLEEPLALASGVHLLDSPWPLGDLFALKDQPDEAVSLDLDRPSRIAVHREGFTVRWRSLDAAEAELLQGAARGATLTTLLESGAFGPEEEAAPFLVSLFVRMVAASILRCPLSAAPVGAATT